MAALHEITADQITGNVIRMIGREWMLITAGKDNQFNMMTASWGGLGFLWGMPVSFCFVRPQRYTYEFMEKHTNYTLSFYGNDYRDALNICGTQSGHDIDKVMETGLTPITTDSGAVYFSEAKLVIESRKLYTHDFDEQRFLDTSIIGKAYSAMDYHRMYVGEITRCLSR